MPSSSSGSQQAARMSSTSFSSRRSPITKHFDIKIVLLSKDTSWSFTQSHKDVLELGEDHGSVVGLVVEFHALNEVFNGAFIFLFLDLAKDGQEFISLDLLLSCRVKWDIFNSDNLNRRKIKINIPFFFVPPIFSI